MPDLFYYYDTRQPASLLGIYVQDHMKIGKTLGRDGYRAVTTGRR